MRRSVLFAVVAGLVLLAGCGQAEELHMNDINPDGAAPAEWDEGNRTTYEIFVYSFCDSDGDGIGDLKGIQSKLDYIKELGFSQIWLTPVCPSPSYHKYDVCDYKAIDAQFGSLEDFDALIAAAHEKGIRVITDLVMNHTSSQHPWFLEAVADEASPYRAYYHFSEEYAAGYNALEGTELYYESQFWAGMPDLALENPAVRAEFEDITDFWLDHGVDGFRLDATGYYGKDNSENIEILKWLCAHVHERSADAYIVGECWSDSSVYLSYLSSGIDSMFNFEFAGRDGAVARCASGELSAAGFVRRMAEYEDKISAGSGSAMDAPFYTNHDMARSAGYYSQGDYEAQIRFAGALNLLMSGNAFVYYGEELGMKGSGKKDENFRAPMLWSDDADAEGMCAGPADMGKLKQVHGSLENQADDPLSIYNYYKNALNLRNSFSGFATGKTQVCEELCTDSYAGFYRGGEGSDSRVLVILNNKEETATVDLSSVPERTLYAALLCGEEGIVAQGKRLPKNTHGFKISGNNFELPAYGIAVLIE